MHADIDERCCTDRYEYMGSQSATPLPILALRANEGAEYERGNQAYKRVQEVWKRKRVQESH
jgi:hypothetical protein